MIEGPWIFADRTPNTDTIRILTIGGHLAEQFAHDGHNVVAVDNAELFYNIGIKKHSVEQVGR